MVQTNPGSPFPENTHAAALFEAVALHPKAPLDRRVLAALLDALVACAPGAAVGALALAAATVSGTVAFVIGLVGGVPAAAWAGYYGFIKDGLGRGQSIGKKKMGLMVVHLQSNAPCSKSQSALRALVMTGLHLIPYLGWLVEPVLVMAAAGGRRLGDQAAGTQVIAADLYRRAK